MCAFRPRHQMPPILMASCSLSRLEVGSAAACSLSLTLTAPVGASVAMNRNDMIVLSGIPQDWTVVSQDPDWQWDSASSALISRSDEAVTIDSTTLSIGLSITPAAATVPAVQVSAALQGSAGSGSAPLSMPSPFVFNLTSPDDPIVAYPAGSAIVILSAPDAVPFPNSIGCQLMATTPSTDVALTLSLHAWDSSGDPVNISKGINGDTVAVQATQNTAAVPFQYDAASWSATVAHWDDGTANALSVTIDGVSLGDSSIALLEARFVVVTGGKSQTTSAWMSSVGPYTISLALDGTNPESGHYCVVPTATGFAVNAFSRQTPPAIHDTPALIATLVDSRNNQSSVGPTAGGFSWHKDEIYYPSSHTLLDSSSLYWCATSSEGVTCPVTSCVITLTQLTPSTPAPLSFIGLDLSGYDFGGWDNLTQAEFSDANLQGANLEGRTLTSAQFAGATLQNAILTGAILTDAGLSAAASLTGIRTGQIRGAPSSLPSDWSLVRGHLIGPGADLRGAELRGAPLTNANLAGADLRHADLRDATLISADLTGASLKSARLGGATLTNATLKDAALCGVQSGSLTGADVVLPSGWSLITGYLVGPGADLNNADLSNADLTGMILTGADLTGANLASATLTGVISGGISGGPSTLPPDWRLVNGYLIGPRANLTSADLGGARLDKMKLSHAKLLNAVLIEVSLRSADLSSADLSHALLVDAILDDTNLSNANLSHTTVIGGRGMGTVLAGVDLSDAVLTRVDVSGMDFSKAASLDGVASSGLRSFKPTVLPTGWQIVNGYLAGPKADLSGADLVGAQLPNAQLKGANLANANLSGVDLTSAELTGATLTNATLVRANLTSADLTNATLTSANLQAAHLDLANLANADLTNANFRGCSVNQAKLDGATLNSVSSGGTRGTPSLPPNWLTVNGYLIGPDANLTNAMLAGVDLTSADLTGANLTGATLQGADLN